MKRTIVSLILLLASGFHVSTSAQEIGSVPTMQPCPGCSASGVVYPESYGAVGNGGYYYDGAITSAAVVGAMATTSVTATAPVVTTLNNNDLVVNVFGMSVSWTTTPTQGSVRESVGNASGYGMFALDNTVTNAGLSATVTGGFSGSQYWNAATIALQSNGSPITFRSGSLVSTTSGGPGISLSVTKPAGAVAGDYLLACTEYYDPIATSHTFIPSPPPSPKWVFLSQSDATVGGQYGNILNCYGKTADSAEPSSYSFPFWQISAGNAGGIVILDYQNVAGVDGQTSVLTSASANFPATATGDPICIGKVMNAFGQRCGTITAVNSAHSVTTSHHFAQTLTALPFSYGTSDDTAFAAMLSSAPCNTAACDIHLGNKNYVLTQALNLSSTYPNSIHGINSSQGAISGAPSVTNGSVLNYLTQTMTNPAFNLTGVSTVTYGTTPEYANFSIIGGVGSGLDGGGTSDGFFYNNWMQLAVSNVTIWNFGGWCVDYAFSQYSNQNFWNGSLIGSCLNGGVNIGGVGGFGTPLGGYAFNNTVIESNGGPAILFSNNWVAGGNASGNIIQWNDITKADYQIKVTGAVGGFDIAGNYIETSNSQGSMALGALGPTTTGIIGIHMGTNYYQGSYSVPTFAAAGVPLPSCGSAITSHQTATVSDSAACTIGTTYVSGGSTRCDLTCNGSNWVETGKASF